MTYQNLDANNIENHTCQHISEILDKIANELQQKFSTRDANLLQESADA